MGILWRLLAPKGLKKARRSVRKVAHPVRTASWALSPKPVKKARRAAFKVAHPGQAIEWAISDQIVQSVRGGTRRKPAARRPAARRPPVRENAAPQGLEVLWIPGSTQIPVAGATYYVEAIRASQAAVRRGEPLEAALIPETANPHDPNAVAVYTAAGQVGHLPRKIAAVMHGVLTAASAAHGGMPVGCPARISVGGYNSAQVVLLIDLGELGIDPAFLGLPSQA